MDRDDRFKVFGALGLVLCLVLCLGMWSCGREEGVRSYRAPKEPGPQVPAGGGRANPHAGGHVGGQVSWTLPAGWESVKSEQTMRLATFRVAGAGNAEVTLAAFPGDVGGDLANINRWRGQLGLAAIDEAGLQGLFRSVGSNGARVVRISGGVASGAGNGVKSDMLGAIVTPGDGQTWFVKCIAPPSSVDAIAKDFEQFAASFSMSAPEGGSARGPGAGPPRTGADAGAGAGSMALPAGAEPIRPERLSGSVRERLDAWRAPAHWKAEEGASAIVTAAYQATNDGGGARITITSLAGDAGGELANINRWRDQLGLAAVGALSDQPHIKLSEDAMLVDLSSPGGDKRMMAGIVPGEGGVWFFKMTGGVKGVEAERASFEALCRVVGVGGP